MRNFLSLLLLTSVSIPISAEEACRYLAYEGFSYSSLSALHGLPGGTGWERGWELQNETTQVPGYQVNGAGSMSTPPLITEGLLATGGKSYLNGGRKLDLSTSGPFAAFLANGAIGLNGKSLWISAQLRKDQNNDTPVWLTAHNDNTPWYLHNPKIGMGFFGASSKVDGIRYWSLQINNKVYPTQTPIITGQPAFLVLNVIFDSEQGNRFQFFVDPTQLGASAAPSPTLTQTIAGRFAIQSLGLYLGSSEGNGALDEIRLTDSWRCATPTADVPINLPPVAAFSASVLDGKAPMTVAFDASASKDASEAPLQYEWNFGDGSSKAFGAKASHTFTEVGQLRTTLTVTSASGQMNTTLKTLVVRDEQGRFPCLSSVALTQRPSCEKADGQLTVFPPTNTRYSLKDAAGTSIAVGAANTYNHLAKGAYHLLVQGLNQCQDDYALNVAEDSATCPGWKPSSCAMDLGMNLDGVTYYSRERAFRDFMKSAGSWISYQAEGPSVWNTGTLTEMPVDADGYPTQIPYASSKGPQAVRGIVSADGHMPAGNYVLLYEGTGSLDMATVADVVKAPGRVAFRVQPENRDNIWFNLTTSQVADPVRNIRIFRAEDESGLQDNPFNPDFLDKLAPFSTIRFLNWSGVNTAQPLNAWEDRTRTRRYTQSGQQGVAFEYMIQLANLLKKDLWITVPHTASDAYVKAMAALFRDQLNPDLKVYIEYSNEVWNFQFSQAKWVDHNGPSHLNYPRKYAERAVKMFRLWQEVFGNQRARLKRVLNIQAEYPWYGREVMAHTDPADYDLVSPAWYFYFGGSCEKTLDQLGAAATGSDVVACARQFYTEKLPLVRQNYLNASLFGKDVVNYEGGQSLTGFGVERTFQSAIYAAQTDPGIYDLYHSVLTDLQVMGSKLAMAYQLAGRRDSKWGSWGHLEDVAQVGPAFYGTAPKYQSLLDNRSECRVEP